MRTTIDKAGRVVVPKPIRDALGLAPGTEIEIQDVDGRVEISVPSRVWLEDGPRGPIAHAPPGTPPMTAEDVREVVERLRRSLPTPAS